MDSQREFFDQHLNEIHSKIWSSFKSLSHFPREIILLPKFPRTTNGKLAVKKLRELCSSQEKISLLSNYNSSLRFYRLPPEVDEGALV
jgi:acyl-coenzyme A synthetase/AMP-(fatty) acid ligase